MIKNLVKHFIPDQERSFATQKEIPILIYLRSVYHPMRPALGCFWWLLLSDLSSPGALIEMAQFCTTASWIPIENKRRVICVMFTSFSRNRRRSLFCLLLLQNQYLSVTYHIVLLWPTVEVHCDFIIIRGNNLAHLESICSVLCIDISALLVRLLRNVFFKNLKLLFERHRLESLTFLSFFGSLLLSFGRLLGSLVINWW